jgi:hypothetical protein
MTGDKMMHQLIGDVYHITNESAQANQSQNRYSSSAQNPKTFLYEFSDEG